MGVVFLIAAAVLIVYGWRLWTNDGGAADRQYENELAWWERFPWGLRPTPGRVRGSGVAAFCLGIAFLIGGLSQLS